MLELIGFPQWQVNGEDNSIYSIPTTQEVNITKENMNLTCINMSTTTLEIRHSWNIYVYHSSLSLNKMMRYRFEYISRLHMQRYKNQLIYQDGIISFQKGSIF